MLKRLLLSLAVLLVAAPAAPAATVVMRDEIERDGGQTYVYGLVELAAAAGEQNGVTLDFRPAERKLAITDAVTPITGDARCPNADAHTVVCDASGLQGFSEVIVDLGDGDDTGRALDVDRLPSVVIRGGAGVDLLAGRWATLDGGGGNDALRGDDGRETLHGGAGDDMLYAVGEGDYLDGGLGADTVLGGVGHDILLGGGGRDGLSGGPGNDSLDDQDGLGAAVPGPDVLDGGPGEDAVHSYVLRRNAVTIDLRREDGQGEAGEDDRLREIESVTGGAGDDTLIGDAGPNRLDGDRGRDVLRGGGGDDVLVSEVNPRETRQNAEASAYGPDRVYGDAGDDVIETLATLESTVACGSGRDAIRMPQTSSDRAHSSRGPLVRRDCERVGMGRVRVDPFPTSVRGGVLTFSVPSPDCCRHRMEVRSASAPLRRTTRVKAGRVRGTVRMKVTGMKGNRFVWRISAAWCSPRSC